MHIALLALTGALLAGGPRRVEAPKVPPVAPGTLIDLSVVFDEQGGRALVGLQKAPVATTPPRSGFRLIERTSSGESLVAERVGAAAYAPDGAILFVRGGELVERLAEGERVLAREVEPDFCLDAQGQRIAVVRRQPSGTSIELLERSGRPLRSLVAASGWNGMPVFTPDGRELLFVSSRTGVASFFKVGADGGGLVQLTNEGLADAAGPRFSPPPETRRGMRFSTPEALDFQGPAGSRFRLDLRARRVRPVEAP